MPPKLKDLLKRLAEVGEVRVVSADDAETPCTVDDDIVSLKEELARLPTSDAENEIVVGFGFEFLGGIVSRLNKEARVKDLEHRLDVAKRDDDDEVDEGERRHLESHDEATQLAILQMSREAELLARFLTIARSALTPSRESADA